MISRIDQSKVLRRARLSHAASLGGLLMLLMSVALPIFNPALSKPSLFLMIVGLGTSMVGIYYANRWVKKPRPEDRLNASLKSLDHHHVLYHYPNSLPCDHILLTPKGVFVLETVNLEGFFTYSSGKWKEKMTSSRALRYIVEEHLGDPIKSAQSAAHLLQGELSEKIITEDVIPVEPIVVFVHPHVALNVEHPPIPVCKVEHLKKRVRLNINHMPSEVYEQIQCYFDSLTAT